MYKKMLNVFREMWIKTKERYHYISIKMSGINETDNTQVFVKSLEELELYYIVEENEKW